MRKVCRRSGDCERAKKTLVACNISKAEMKMQNIPGSTTDLGQSELDTPDLTLVTETVLADTLQLRVPISRVLTTSSIDMNRASSSSVASGRY